MQAPVIDRIRDEIRLKLWGNVCLNPINALTHATLDVICSDPATRALSKAIMLESQAIAEKFGVKFRVDVERRIEGAQGRRAQDLDAAGSGTRTPSARKWLAFAARIVRSRQRCRRTHDHAVVVVAPRP